MNLTGAQARALYCLLKAKAWKVRVPKGRETMGDGPWNVRVNSVAVQRLVDLGLARERNVLVDGTEVVGADLFHCLGYWKTKFEVTRRGQQAWRRFTVRQRYGLPEVAS